MSLKMKLVSAITAMILMLGIMLTGILATSLQTITMQGSVNFEIADKSLYVQDVRMKEDSMSNVYSLKEQGRFMPGYINGNFNMNLGEFTNSYGSFALYFDIINTSSSQYTATASTTQAGVEVLLAIQDTSGGVLENIPSGTVSPKEITSSTPASASLVLTVTSSSGTKVDLSLITITIDEYIPPPVYERVDEDGTSNPEGDYLYIGYYPQSLITEGVEVDTSTTDSRGYYLGSDEEYYAMGEDGNYYKVERLKWRILDDNYGDGTALIVCDVIVDQVAYQTNYRRSGSYYYVSDGSVILVDNDATIGEGVNSNHQVYANNYKWSELRTWLNKDFYDSFTDAEKSSIVLTEVDNSTASGADSPYACENTNDYIFALSYNDIFNTDYGFTSGSGDPKKAFVVTDYAEANGVYVTSSSGYEGTGYGWLRSPIDTNYGYYTVEVRTGYCYNYAVSSANRGALPALQIRL